jgi:hypothetical protein
MGWLGAWLQDGGNIYEELCYAVLSLVFGNGQLLAPADV